MGYIILIGIIILIIYGIVKFIIWVSPYVAKGMGIVLAVGAVVGLAVGVFYAIKNYMASILENIHHKGLKVFMMFLSSIFTLFLIGALFLSSVTVYNSVVGGIGKKASAPVTAAVKTSTKYITEDVHFQEGPSWGDRSLAILRTNSEVTVYDDESVGNWVKIKYNDLTGYVESKYLKESR